MSQHAKALSWMHKLPVVNIRCNTRHPESDERYCGRSNVRKKDYPNGNQARYKAFRDEFNKHSDKADELRTMAQADPNIEGCEPFDSLKAWCECRKDQ